MDKDILKILDNVRYWETCPEDYKKTIEQFLTENNHALQLLQTGVSTCFLEDYIDNIFGNKITYKQTSCCKTAPITNENYCPNCGNKILK